MEDATSRGVCLVSKVEFVISKCRQIAERASSALLLLVFTTVARASAEVLFSLASPNEITAGHFGVSVSGAGDVDGDGFDDIVIGAFGEEPGPSPEGAGRAYVFSGLSGDIIRRFSSPNEEYLGSFGYSVSGAGDVDGDRHSDIVVGAHWEDPGTSPDKAGRAYVFSGATGSLMYELRSPNEEQVGFFGHSVAGAGDVNGDGFDDIVVGAYYENPDGGPEDAGRAYLFGGDTGTLLHTLISPDEQAYGLFGYSVAGAGDVNGDGYGDVIVGAHYEESGASPDFAGRAYIFDGATGSALHTLVSPHEEVFGLFGFSVSGAADVDGDGLDDVVVSAYLEDPGTSPQDAGRVYVFNGESGELIHALASPNEEDLGNFGYAVSGAGDVNGDNHADVIVGAHFEDPGSSPDQSGRAYLFSGLTGALMKTLISPNEERIGRFGYSVSGAGDVTGDSHSDIVVGAWFENPDLSPEAAGRAYLFSWMDLHSSIADDVVILTWSPWIPATEYWVFGAPNLPFFTPGGGPDHEFRLAVLLGSTVAWSSSADVGNSDENWTYLVMAVDRNGAELARSSRAGEHEFEYAIP